MNSIVVCMALALAAPAAPAPTPPARPAKKKLTTRPAPPRMAPRKAPRPATVRTREAVGAVPPAALTPPDADRGGEMSWGRWALWNGLAGFGVAALLVPTTLALGHEIGKYPSNYIAAALPGLLLLWILPPAAVATTQYLLSNRFKPGRVRFHPAFWTALGVQLVAMTVAIAAGATTHELGGVAAFAVVDALVLPSTVLLLHYVARRKARRAAAASPRGPLPRAGSRERQLSLIEERVLARRHGVRPEPQRGALFNVLRMRF